MLKLETHLPRSADRCFAPNLTDKFSVQDLEAIGQHCWEGYDRDEQSRETWLRRTQAGMQLAMQISEEKTFPWPNCANIAFPLVTIAALQFHSRSYPAMFAGPDIVKYRVPGPDLDGKLTANATLVARYMSHQCLDLDESFEEQHDRLLINVPIVGCAFIKTRRNTARGTNSSSLVLARDFVIDYYAKSVEGAMRKTQIIPLYRNEIYERCVAGKFRDIREEAWYKTPFQTPSLPHTAEVDRRQGVSPPQADESTPILFGEQHTWLDLDGDGYAEPYIVVFDLVNKQVVQIAARWEAPEDVEFVGRQILRINATEYFTKYGLIPAPDGSIYDIGFGVLLGPLNESVNTLVNQLMDAGSMANGAGGFLARGVKVRGGAITFQPFGWQHVDSSGDDLRKGIFPLPVREPSAVLFNLLSLLINYTQRISGSTDTMVGENPGQNTPANNMNLMVEQGLQVFTAIFKRMWRSMRDEFRKGFVLNARHMPSEVKFGSSTISRQLFLGDPSALVPAADPNLVSDSMKMQQAVAIKQAAATTPGYNPVEVEKRFLQTLRVDGIEVLFPGPDKIPPGKDIKIQLEEMRLQREGMRLQTEMQKFMLQLREEHLVNQAKILQLEAQAAKLLAEVEGADEARELEQFRTLVDAYKARNEAINQSLQTMTKAKEAENAANQPAGVQ
jgi:chaperonin GroES